MAVFNIEVEIPDHEDPELNEESYIYDCIRDITIGIEDAGYKYKLTVLS